MSKIAVSQLPNIGCAEDHQHEFKTSIFIDPTTRTPGVRQMTEIAKSLCAFMNADGGELYLGVRDDGTLVGIDDDLRILGQGNIVARGPFWNDDGHSYDATVDKYILKVRAIVRAYLETFAGDYVTDIQSGKVKGVLIVRVVVTAAPKDKIVYFNERGRFGGSYTQEIFVRRGNQKNKLAGFDRDQFVRERYGLEMMAKMRAMQSEQPQISTQALLQGLQAMIVPQVRNGANVIVTGGQPLTEEAIKSMSSPKGLIFDGEHVRDVKSWKDCYLALLEKLNSIDPARFADLPDERDFSKNFVRQAPRTRCVGCYAVKFGTALNVRAKEVTNKAYFYNPNAIVHKLLAHFGVAADRIMIRA